MKIRERYGAQVDGLRALGVLVAIMWAVEVVNVLDSYRLDRDGILPRNVSHLYGVVFAPFLHASFSHLLGNTIPFVILGCAIAVAGAERLLVVSLIVALVSGLGVWLTAPGGTVTVGASGVVFGYATYLISRGLFDRRIVEVAFGVVVLLLFGVLISDLTPHSGISWEAPTSSAGSAECSLQQCLRAGHVRGRAQAPQACRGRRAESCSRPLPEPDLPDVAADKRQSPTSPRSGALL